VQDMIDSVRDKKYTKDIHATRTFFGRIPNAPTGSTEVFMSDRDISSWRSLFR